MYNEMRYVEMIDNNDGIRREGERGGFEKGGLNALQHNFSHFLHLHSPLELWPERYPAAAAEGVKSFHDGNNVKEVHTNRNAVCQ